MQDHKAVQENFLQIDQPRLISEWGKMLQDDKSGHILWKKIRESLITVDPIFEKTCSEGSIFGNNFPNLNTQMNPEKALNQATTLQRFRVFSVALLQLMKKI